MTTGTSVVLSKVQPCFEFSFKNGSQKNNNIFIIVKCVVYAVHVCFNKCLYWFNHWTSVS